MTNSRSKSEENEPLLYIVQPTVTQTKRSMQYFFSTKQEEVTAKKTEDTSISLKDKPTFSAIKEVNEAKAEVSEQKKDKEKSLSIVPTEVKKREAKKPNKMFQSMNIEEKISFLCDFPKHMSQPICEVTVENSKHIGNITGIKEGQLCMVVPPNETELKFALETVKNISIVKI
ncbi:hypothetical protein FZC66_15465 [Priestia megaterium]|nr:hypothetical protein FZC66_15465 [Priestia megaterium]